MYIIENLSAEVPDTNAYHFNIKEFSDGDKDTILFYGYDSPENSDSYEATRKILFNNWAPCEFAQFKGRNGFDAVEYDNGFDDVYTICPYTAKWLNEVYGLNKYKTIFYPFHKSLVPEPQKKLYDVVYHGGIHGKEHVECLQVMSKFNYQYITMTHHINSATSKCLKYATNRDLPFREKIDFVAKTKVSVCYNIVHNLPHQIEAIKSYDCWGENEAFSETEGWNVMPQFKTRMHEAAISKSLNLVQRDPWNIAEMYYEPDTEFLYFDDAQDLENKISEIISNWSEYEPMTERAYNRALDYTTENFVDAIKDGGSWTGRNNNEVQRVR